MPFHFWLPLLPLYFKHFLLASSFSQVEEKKKKTLKKKKNAKKWRSLPSSFHSTLSLLAPTFGLLFLPFCFKHFLLRIFFFSSRREKKITQKKKKNHRGKKKCREGRELTFLFSLLHLGWSAPLDFSSPHSFNIELSTFLKPCVSRLPEALCYSSLGALPSSGDGVSGKCGEGGRQGR